MGFDASRAFARIHSWATDKANSVLVTASRMDADSDAVAEAVNELAEYQRDDTINYYANAGTADALAATVLPVPTEYATGMRVSIKVAADNTSTTPTLNLNGLGVKTIVNTDGTALAAADIESGGIYEFRYDGTNFQILNPKKTEFDATEFAALSTATSVSGTDFIAVYSSGSGLKRDTIHNAVSGKQTIWVPAGAMTPNTTNGAAAGTIETETTANAVMFGTLDFDPTTDESAQFDVAFPNSWDKGTLTYKPFWTHATATSYVGRIGLQAVALSSDDALDASFGTAIHVLSTGGTTLDLYSPAESSALTVAGSPGNGELTKFKIFRDADATADTLSTDFRLIGVQLFYTTDAKSDD